MTNNSHDPPASTSWAGFKAVTQEADVPCLWKKSNSRRWSNYNIKIIVLIPPLTYTPKTQKQFMALSKGIMTIRHAIEENAIGKEKQIEN